MNREDIIKLAREAQLGTSLTHKGGEQRVWIEGADWHDELERFAALVAAAEREKVARWQIGSGYTTGHGDTIEDLLVELEWQVRESEREACAAVCCDMIDAEYKTGKVDHNEMAWTQACANAIRARGEP